MKKKQVLKIRSCFCELQRDAEIIYLKHGITHWKHYRKSQFDLVVKQKK